MKAEIRGEIISTSRRDSLGAAAMYVDGALIASMNRIIYSHVHMVDQDELSQLFRYYSGTTNGDIS
ncbi:MAG TPA: hypothetical protein DCP92_19980 [Nitrospiraceae bacterium]|nr:hypothetical protein [Nitrospiraceae bacterium]